MNLQNRVEKLERAAQGDTGLCGCNLAGFDIRYDDDKAEAAADTGAAEVCALSGRAKMIWRVIYEEGNRG
jgi:hypothetical protein